uniref:acrosomal protein KIAA1210 homolog isoform X5 n=1 Tax=Podarcis muralis TaxID=64176 RepID=UPI00109F163C|nr:acrosomal protein KIAA1210 homolog isoform X5 [Podarcis muralis]
MAAFYSCLNFKRCGRWSVRSQSECRNRNFRETVMATGVYEIEPCEVEETEEECSKKKRSRFQTFKNFFSKKKKNKEQPSSLGEIKLKPSQSSSDVSIRNLDSCILHLPIEPGSKGNMGNKALSHDSVFTVSSPETFPGKVKALQLQLQPNLVFRSPPLVIPSKRMEEVGGISEDDGLPRSPKGISTLHDVLICSTNKSSIPAQRYNSLSLGGTDSEDDQVTSESASRPLSPQPSAVVGSPALPYSHLLPVDFSRPPTPLGCLDTSAAKHKIAINPRKQKAFTHKNQTISVKEVAKQQGLLKPREGKPDHEKLLEEDGRKKEGLAGQTPAPHLESTSSEPAWILMAKLKQKGFQGHPLAKEQTWEDKTSAKTEQGGEKRSSISQQEKMEQSCRGKSLFRKPEASAKSALPFDASTLQTNFTSENILKKTSAPQVRALESKTPLKMAPAAIKATSVRTKPQEAPQMEKETRPLPSLPMSSCSPAEPPWLSLARKKAKAWSEMPQIVQ